MIRFILRWGGIGLLIAAVGFGLWWANRDNGPELPGLEPIPHWVHNTVARQIADEWIVGAGTESVAILPVVGDPTDALRVRIGRTLEAEHGLDVSYPNAAVAPTSWLEGALDQWVPMLASASSRPEAMLVATVARHRDDRDETSLAVDWSQRSVEEPAQLISAGTAESQLRKSVTEPEYLRWSILAWGSGSRFLMWLAVGLGLPILATRWWVSGLKRESNAVNGALLLLVALPGTAAGWLLTGFGTGAVGAGLTVVAAATAFAFAFLYLTWVEEAR
ncbi:MAG: hypothetical protein AAF488_17570 [Planctomycetota bacterium]